MAEQELLIFCPIWQVPCMRERCVGYEVHTKQRFKNIPTDTWIPVDQLSYYRAMPQSQLDTTIERHITIVRECKLLGKIIEIENSMDHLIPGV